MNAIQLESIARAAHEVNRAYCLTLGDTSQKSWEDAAEWQHASAIADIEKALSGAGPRAQHEAWCEHKLKNGWKYGLVKDADKKEHPCLVDYNELPAEQKAKDALYIEVVKAMTKAITLNPSFPVLP